MDCNKEEAIRAKDIAEKKMLSEDFVSAKKIVLKAQQLFPELENASQMLTVCEVHCSAAVKFNGDMDWYGILQVGPTADESTIKKQFRKLALLLHPDKNKFGGAEAAFKLVGEAHRTLTDSSKRAQHDMRRGTCFRMIPVNHPNQQQNRASFAKKQPGVATNFVNAQFNGLNQQPKAPYSSNQTFWTICPACAIRYQYFKNILNRALTCPSCKKPFVAYEFNPNSVPSAAPWNRGGFPRQENKAPSAHTAGQKSNFAAGSSTGFQGNPGGGSVSEPSSVAGCNSEFGGGSNNTSKENVKVDGDGDVKFEKVNLHNVSRREPPMKPPTQNRGQKRGRKLVVESSDSESSDSDIVVCDGYSSGQNAGSQPRRSTRQKQNISYNENKSDDDDDDLVIPQNKRSVVRGTSLDTEDDYVQFQGEATNGLHEREQGKKKPDVDFILEDSPEPNEFSYPDPEFGDFETERDASNFAADQIWAVYDNLDAMPRYYVLIRQVYRPKFKLRFNWLEFDPTCKAEALWFKGGLPIGCGNFKLGKSETTQERLMFSHLMTWSKGTKRNLYVISPKKGEVWALFKNWTIEWGFCVDKDRQYEYEIVEVLSEFSEGDVIDSARLVKVQGFESLFVQATDKGSTLIKIQMKDILQFSHKIPSYRLTGNEREGIPKGALELDCASLPVNFGAVYPSVSLESIRKGVEELNTECSDSHFKPAGHGDGVSNSTASEERERSGNISCNRNYRACEKEPIPMADDKHIESEKVRTDGEKADATSKIENLFEYPDAEFHNFEEERSFDKFEQGQIWALYSDINKFPNYYAQITKIEVQRSSAKFYVTWLEGYSEKVEEKPWLAKQLPSGCGSFRLTRENFTSDSRDTFSHIVHAIPTGRKDLFAIYPRVGEIWAVYRNWKLGWSLTEIEDCEFDVVEVLSVSSSSFQVSVLSKVNGYRAVFRSERKGIDSTIDIPIAEQLKFSHQIPACRLTEERGGKLRGCWELDPAAVPDLLLFTSS